MAGNQQTQTAVHARGEKGGLSENTVLNPLHGVQFATHANGKIERWHQTLKADCLRLGCPLSLQEAQRLVERFVAHYNNVRLHSAIGYITPADRLAARHLEIFAARDKKLDAARQNRKLKCQQVTQQQLP
jgi:Integrase core domain